MKWANLGLFLLSLVLVVAVNGCDRGEGDPKTPSGGGPGRPTPSEPEDAEPAEEAPEPATPVAPAHGYMQYTRAEVEKCIAALETGDDGARGAALMSLPADPRHFEKEPGLLTELVIPALLDVAGGDAAEMNRGVAVSMLCGMGAGGAEAVPGLIRLLDDDQARQHVAFGIAKLGDPAKAAIPKLIELVGSSDDLGKAHAAEGLGMFGADAAEAVPALAGALRSEKNVLVRLKAAHALGKIGPAARAALPALEEAARTGPGNVRYACNLAVKAIKGE